MTNPFDREENLTFWFNRDPGYILAKQIAYIQYKNILQPQMNLFMIIQEQYLKLLYIITRHTAVAALILGMLLSSVGAVAAEVAAPEQYKPSTAIKNLFAKNKQLETDPYTKLTPDPANDVASLEACDLAIKYPKNIAQLPVGVYYQNLNDSQPVPAGYISGATVSSRESIENLDKPEYTAAVRTEFLSFGCAQNLDSISTDSPSTASISKEQLRDITGWFITAEADITDIKDVDSTISGPYHKIVFRYKNLYYYFNFVEKPLSPDPIRPGIFEAPGIFGDQIQIQFNSLAKNQISSEILTQPKSNPQSNQTSTTKTSTTEIQLSGTGCRTNPNSETDFSGSCNLVNQDGKILTTLFDCKTESLNCVSIINLGKKTGDTQYIVTEFGDTFSTSISIREFNLTTQALTVVGNFTLRISQTEENCDPLQDSTYSARCYPELSQQEISEVKLKNNEYLQAREKYMLGGGV
jgi:hypothetical protein